MEAIAVVETKERIVVVLSSGSRSTRSNRLGFLGLDLDRGWQVVVLVLGSSKNDCPG